MEHYNTLGYIIVVISILSVFLIYRVSALIKGKTATTVKPKEELVLSAHTEV